MSKGRMPWVKVRWPWYGGQSNAHLDGVALALGPVLMLLCRRSVDLGLCEIDQAWCLTETGKAMTAAEIAMVVRFTPAKVRKSLAALCDAGTVVQRADGAFGLPNFRKYQETPEAARMRVVREQSDKTEAESDGKTEPQPELLANSSPQEVKRIKSVNSPVTPQKPKRARKNAVLEKHRAACKELWAEQERLRSQFGRKESKPNDEKLARIAALLEQGETVEDCKLVLLQCAAECRENPASIDYFNGITNWRPKNFEFKLGRIGESLDLDLRPGDESAASPKPRRFFRNGGLLWEAGNPPRLIDEADLPPGAEIEDSRGVA